MLSFRFAGAFLLRLGARTLSALLFHPPPRRTAWFGLALACGACAQHKHSAESNSTKHVLPQAIGISVRRVSEPALHRAVDGRQAGESSGVEFALEP
jgi:hypothetical protein